MLPSSSSGTALATSDADAAFMQSAGARGGQGVQTRSLEQRVTSLEQQMQELTNLPVRIERLESQILQLRTEMKDGVSAIRSDLGAELHGVEAGLRTAFRTELHDVRDSLRNEIRELREDIRIGVEESQNLARGLHGQAMAAVSTLRADVMSKLDQILALRTDADRGSHPPEGGSHGT